MCFHYNGVAYKKSKYIYSQKSFMRLTLVVVAQW
jgi:hypothetical protein